MLTAQSSDSLLPTLLGALRSYCLAVHPDADSDRYAEVIIWHLDQANAGSKARAAAMNCDVPLETQYYSVLQSKLFSAACGFIEAWYRAKNPNVTALEDRADAFAAALVEPITPAVEAHALREAQLRLEPRWSPWNDVIERDREFERNRRRPKPKALYPC